VDPRRPGDAPRAAGWESAARSDAGMAFVMTLLVVFFVGMMLFAFVFTSQSGVWFAANDRNSTVALELAEAGVQEALNRLRVSGVGATGTFANSLAASAAAAHSSGTVTLQAPLAINPTIIPILSVAAYGGMQRAARVLVQAAYQPGFGNVVQAPLVVFQGDASAITGDTSSLASVTFQTYQTSPAPASGATATNLISPQVMAGTDITTQGSGPGDFFFECANDSTTEVAPTTCMRQTNLPINWHPATPQGMPSADFTAVILQWNGSNANLPSGLQVVQATQGGVGVTYTSAGTYTPTYWTTVAATAGQVLLIVDSGGPFCVNGASVTAGVCTGLGTLYGDVSGGGADERYLDWGLVADDLSRTTAVAFFQAPTCATCNAGGPNGNQNGVRYVSLIPPVDVLGIACNNNLAPGFSAFSNVSSDGMTCAAPPTLIGSGTFTGTKSNPEFLVIDNGAPGGAAVTITGTGRATGCSDAFASANWGVIVATGDLTLQDFAFDGVIYTLGNVYTQGHIYVKGGIFSGTPSTTQVDQSSGTLSFCGGASVSVPMAATFFNFTPMSWVDRPAGQP